MLVRHKLSGKKYALKILRIDDFPPDQEVYQYVSWLVW